MLKNIKITNALLLGQVLSALITVTSIATQSLSQYYGINIPTTQNFLCYLFLSSFLLKMAWEKRFIHWDFEISAWKYLIITLADVEANYLIVCSYKYTTISSVMLLDCFTIPVVMILSTLFLNAKYSRHHILGAGVSVCGIFVVVVSDIARQQKDAGNNLNSKAFYGDFLSLLGSAIYGASNVAQEYIVKTRDRHEFLGVLGCFGALIAGTQSLLLERNDVLSIHWQIGSVFFLFLYVVSLSSMYIFTSIFLIKGDSAMFNLSLLTSDFYAVIAGIFLFHEEYNFFYGVGFILIVTGLIWYHHSNPPTQTHHFESNEFKPILLQEKCVINSLLSS